MLQTSLDQSFSAKRYETCFWDVRAPVADTATDRTCRIVDQLPWKRTCVRSYSAMNATQSKERSRMLTDLLNDLMKIKLNGSTIEGVGDDTVKDLIDKAFKEWHSR